ncbi:MAG: hypothetical protein V1738_00335 [Patescibacteria group bacterium]
MNDIYEATREIVKLLESLNPEDQEQAIKWASERLNICVAKSSAQQPPATTPKPQNVVEPASCLPPAESTDDQEEKLDIKSFYIQKDPKNDIQFTAVVAYHNKFIADSRKETVSGNDLLEACRKVNRNRVSNPSQTLLNAFNAGYLDRLEHGVYTLSTVGENLVDIVLPNGDVQTIKKTSRQTKTLVKKAPTKKTAGKKIEKQPKPKTARR